MLKINPTKADSRASISMNDGTVLLVTLVITLTLRVTTKNCVQSERHNH